MAHTKVTLRVAKLLILRANELFDESTKTEISLEMLEPCELEAYATAWKRISKRIAIEEKREHDLPPIAIEHSNRGEPMRLISAIEDDPLILGLSSGNKHEISDFNIRRCATKFYLQNPDLIPKDVNQIEWTKWGHVDAAHADKISAFITNRSHHECNETDRVRKRIIALSKSPLPAVDLISSIIKVVPIEELNR